MSSVKGFKSTARSIRSMVPLVRRPISESSRKALAPVLAAAKANLRTPKSGRPAGNVVTGELVRGMKIMQKKSRRGKVETLVTATGKAISRAHLVEFGTEPHWQPKRKRMHPGARAFPFLTPAFEENDDEAKRIFAKQIGSAIERQARRANRKKS